MSAPVHVLPHERTRGLGGDPAALPEGESAPRGYDYVTLERAFSGEFEGDAHLTMYVIPGETASPRINQSAWPWLQSLGKEPVMVRVLIDVDWPGHASWADHPTADAEWALALKTLEEDPLLRGVGWYHTRGGYRLWWELPAPLPVTRWHGFIQRFNAYLLARGIPIDPQVKDATRLMRAPRATRDGVLQDLPRSAHLPGPLRWTPGVPLPASALPSPGELTDRPESPELTEGTWAMLRRAISGELWETLKAGRPLAPPPSERSAGDVGRNSAMMQTAGLILDRLPGVTAAQVYGYLYASVVDVPESDIDADTLWDRVGYLVQKHAAAIAPPPAPSPTALPTVDDDGEDIPLDDLADLQAAVDAVAAAGDRAKRVLLTDPTAKAFWVYDEAESRKHGLDVYAGPFASSAVPMALGRKAPALAGSYTTSGGNPYGMPRLLLDMGQVVEEEHISYQLGQPRTVYQDGRLTCKAAPWRPGLTPREHPDVAQWLEYVGGDRVRELLDWLATFRQLNQATCGLYIKGPKGIGKQCLALGLARLFASGEVFLYKQLIKQFWDPMLRTALVWADETIPRDHKGATPTAVFRSLVTDEQRPIDRKGLPILPLNGCVRLLVTANNSNVFQVKEDLEPGDVEAIISRIGYIEADERAARYLEDIGGRGYTDRWVQGNALAEHVLWLEANREVTPGPRFLVQGWRTAMHDEIMQKAGIVQLVLTLMALILDNWPSEKGQGAVLVRDGGLWVNAAKFRDRWTTHLPDARPPSHYRMTSALQNLARPWNPEGDTTKNQRVGQAVRSYWHVDSASVMRTAEGLQIGDPAAIRKILTESAD